MRLRLPARVGAALLAAAGGAGLATAAPAAGPAVHPPATSAAPAPVAAKPAASPIAANPVAANPPAPGPASQGPAAVSAAAAAAPAAPGAASTEPVLRVIAIGGVVQANRIGEVRTLQLGDAVGEREVLRLAADARLVLSVQPQGQLELGPGAELAIEKLPPTAAAPDRRSILNLQRGYLHLAWAQPETSWPLYLYGGGQRARVAPGEYFFERQGDTLRSCVAGGQLAVNAIVGEATETLRPSACYGTLAAGKPKAQPRSAEAWALARRDFSLEPHSGLVLAELRVPAAPVDPAAELAGAAPGAAASGTALDSSNQPGAAVAGASTLPAAAGAPAAALAANAPARGTASPAQPNLAQPSLTAAAPAPLPAPVVAPAPSSPPPKLAAVAPPPAPDALPPPVPTSDSEPQWAVLIGSFADPQNAAAVQARLIGAGYTPFLRVKNVDGKTFNSVQIRGFATREAAEARVAELNSKLGLANLKVVFLQ